MSLASSESWLVNAFVSAQAAGNPTGVVFAPPGVDEAWCARVARALRVPDTAFLWAGEGGWRVRFYSPWEGELALCGQALIACDAVLRASGRAPSLGLLGFHTQVGEVATVREEEAPERAWLVFPRSGVSERPAVAALVEGSGTLLPPGGGPARVVDSGRTRVFCQLPSDRALEAVHLGAAQVLAFCRAQGLSGVCLWARTGPRQLVLRVFTVSLEGEEDVATGGAVLGLAALLLPEEGPWEVRQGSGTFRRRGALWLQEDVARGQVRVGGEAELVLRGALQLTPGGRGPSGAPRSSRRTR